MVFGLARRGSTIGVHLLCHTVELARRARLCLSRWCFGFCVFAMVRWLSWTPLFLFFVVFLFFFFFFFFFFLFFLLLLLLFFVLFCFVLFCFFLVCLCVRACVCVFLCWKLHRDPGWSWLAVRVLWTSPHPGGQSLLMAMLHSLIERRRFRPQTQWRPLRKTLTSGLRRRYVFGLARSGSTIDFHLLWHTIELTMSTRLCLL